MHAVQPSCLALLVLVVLLRGHHHPPHRHRHAGERGVAALRVGQQGLALRNLCGGLGLTEKPYHLQGDACTVRGKAYCHGQGLHTALKGAV